MQSLSQQTLSIANSMSLTTIKRKIKQIASLSFFASNFAYKSNSIDSKIDNNIFIKEFFR